MNSRIRLFASRRSISSRKPAAQGACVSGSSHHGLGQILPIALHRREEPGRLGSAEEERSIGSAQYRGRTKDRVATARPFALLRMVDEHHVCSRLAGDSEHRLEGLYHLGVVVHVADPGEAGQRIDDDEHRFRCGGLRRKARDNVRGGATHEEAHGVVDAGAHRREVPAKLGSLLLKGEVNHWALDNRPSQEGPPLRGRKSQRAG